MDGARGSVGQHGGGDGRKAQNRGTDDCVDFSALRRRDWRILSPSVGYGVDLRGGGADVMVNDLLFAPCPAAVDERRTLKRLVSEADGSGVEGTRCLSP